MCRRIASTISSVGGSVYSWPRYTQTRQAIWSPQPSVQASEPHEVSRRSSAMSLPLTRMVGEDTNRHARASSSVATCTLVTSTAIPAACSTSATTINASLRLRSVPRHRVQLVRSRNKKSICSFRRGCCRGWCASVAVIVSTLISRSVRRGQVCHPSRRANRALDASADRSPPGCRGGATPVASIGVLCRLPW